MKHAFVPRNLDMSVFGEKADKIAMILNHLYRIRLYKNDYGFAKQNKDFSRGVALGMNHLRKVVGENASPLMDMICHSKRHDENGTHPIQSLDTRPPESFRNPDIERRVMLCGMFR